MVFCAKCGKKLNEGARFCPRCGTPVGEQGGAGTSVSQSGGGSSGTFSWEQAGQMRDLSREFQESDVEQNKLMAVLSYFSLLVLLPILCAKDSKYARFHANQGLMLLLVCRAWYSLISSYAKSMKSMKIILMFSKLLFRYAIYACINLDLPDRRMPVMILMSGVPFSSMILSRYFALVIVFI